MSDLERLYLEDTWAILIDYDGRHSEDGLKSLIDEARDRIHKILHNQVTRGDVYE